jgi:integrase/recombinase XerD
VAVAVTLLEDFKADCQLRNIDRQGSYYFQVSKFCDFLEARGKEPCQVEKDDLKAYLQVIRDRGLKTSSQRKMFTSLSAFYAFVVDEGLMELNPIMPFRRRYLRQYKDNGFEPRQLISIDQAAMLINSVLHSRDKAFLTLLFKTGMRLGELCSLDVGDLDLKDMSLVVKPTAKRSNRQLFFDHETARMLQAWLASRPNVNSGSPLFISTRKQRISLREVEALTKKHASRVGLHNQNSEKLADRFTPHCCRHWLVTHLLRAGMSRDHVKWIRGDAMKESIDIYYHIDSEDVRKSYMAYVPQLGI